MTIHTAPHLTGTYLTQDTTLGGHHQLFLSGEDRHQLLKLMAEELNLCLVTDRDRTGLLALAQEVDEDDNDYTDAWHDLAEDMATAITQAFPEED